MTKKVFLAISLFVALCALVFTQGAMAQFNARLTGSVLDTTQAAIPGATVVLTNQDTKATQSATSSGEGAFTFNALPPGNYTLVATANGFKQNTVSNVVVVAETPRSLNLTLSTGAENTTVNVDADVAALLQTADASIGSTVSSEEIQRLPIFGADPYELLRTAPGISGDAARSGNGQAVFLPNGAGPGGSNSGVYQTENQPQISANGQRVADNNFMIDGVSVNSLTHGGAAVVSPNEEAVGAITVISSSYDASLGRNTGAQIQVVTKSGTNQLHGSLFFLYDEPGLNQYNKYAGPVPNALTTRDNLKQRTWAASLGGPIVKDKLFFFTSFQEYKLKNPTVANQYVLTPQFRAAIAAQRAGGISAQIVADPSSQPQILNILTPNCSGLNPNPLPPLPPIANPNCAVVAGGLDLGSLTPGGTSQLGVFPTTNLGGGLDGVPDVMYAQVAVPGQSRGNQYNARIDYQLTQKDLLAGSFYLTKLDNLGSSGTAPAAPQSFIPFKPQNSAATLIYIHTFSSSWINELRGNGTRFADNGVVDGGNTVNYGIPYVNVQNYPFPIQFGVNASPTSGGTFAQNTYEVRDTVSHTFGSHTIRAGAEFRFEQDNDNLSGSQRPIYAFNGLFAFANDASVYEAITANPNTGGPANTQRYFRSQNFAGFIQHDWKVTPNFTFNTGLRWELFTPLSNKGMQINYPVLGPAGSELAGMKLLPRNALWNPQYKNFGPKIGFAWTPAVLNNKVVVRGGYALAYNHLDIALFNPALEDGPNIANFGLCCGGNGNKAGIVYEMGTSHSPGSFAPNPNIAIGVNANGFPNGGNQIEVYGAGGTIKYPSTDLFSLEVQNQLPWSTTFTFGYSGSTGHHFARLVNQNFLYNQANSPVFAAYFAQTDSVQNYHALNMQLRRPTRHGVSYSLVYTYSKSMDQVSNGDYADGSANQTNPGNNASEYGPSDYDLKHRVVGTLLYTSPKIHTHNAFADALVNGFQVNATYTYHTGFPWTPVTTNLNTVPVTKGAATQNVVRPVAYTGTAGNSCSNSAFTTGSNFSNRTTANPGGGNYFTTILPPAGVYAPGIGRNSFRGPCYQDTDLGLAKEFAHDFSDRHTLLRLQANMHNVFNQTQLQPIGNNTSGSNIANQYFGYSQGSDAGRVIELLARFQF